MINCNFTNNHARRNGGALYFNGWGNVTNCNFVDNGATNDYGGAVRLAHGTVTNCNFTNNTAPDGGAVYFYSGTVTNCNFNNNNATILGGSIYFMASGDVENCSFTNNTAPIGGAIYSSYGNVINCNFTRNVASNSECGAIYSTGYLSVIADTCIFKTDSDSTYQVRILSPTLNVDNFTAIYNSGKKQTFNLTTNSGMPVNDGNISISVYYTINDTWVDNYTCLVSEGWAVDLPVGSYYAIYNTEYAGFKLINRTITIMPAVLYANVVPQTTHNRTVNITAISNIPNDNIKGKLIFILPNNVEINATYVSDGIWWAVHTFDEYKDYQVNASYIGLDDVKISNATISISKANSTLEIGDIVFDYGNAGSTSVSFTNATGITAKVVNQPKAVVTIKGNKITVSNLNAGTYTLAVTTKVDEDHAAVTETAKITVNKMKTQLAASAITTTYNINKNLVITLKDAKGKALSGIKVAVNLNGAKTYKTDKNGQVKVPTKGLAPKAYTAKITFNGNANYAKSAKNVKVTVKKATPKITAKKKTFKAKTKVKKYAITLKDNTGKAIKKAKVTLKVKGKTYKATTNSKGKAIFKIKNLKKKGKYTAVIKFKGDKYYKAVTKKVKLTVKPSKVKKSTFKTVSEGSKDEATVKKIQQALKDHGYYLTYAGHYLMVDGKFSSCTLRSVKEFQQDNGLKVTGEVDEKTAKKLGII